MKSYSSFKVKFEFPEHVRYPNIAVRLGEGSVTFPLKGIGYCTGIEMYYAVTALGCNVTVDEGYLIPFLSKKSPKQETNDDASFAKVIEGVKGGKRGNDKQVSDYSVLFKCMNE